MFCPLGCWRGFLEHRGSPVFPAAALLTSPSKSLCRLTIISCELWSSRRYGECLWCFAGHYMSFFGSRSWLFVPVSRVPSSVSHGQRPRRRIQVLAGRQTGSACVNMGQSLWSATRIHPQLVCSCDYWTCSEKWKSLEKGNPHAPKSTPPPTPSVHNLW